MAAGGIARLQAKPGGVGKRAGLPAEPRGEVGGILGRGLRSKWSEPLAMPVWDLSNHLP